MIRLLMPLLIALQFLTTLPITLPVMPSHQQNASSLLFYPLVGLLIGLVLFVMTWINLPLMLLSALIVAAWAYLTGGLHLDGLADTADAWVGGLGDRQRTLDIMKDVHTGAMGVVAIVSTVMLKWAGVYSLLSLNLPMGLMFVPMLGRLGILMLLLTTPYIRPQGLGSPLINHNKTILMIVIMSYMITLGLLPVGLAAGLVVGLIAIIGYLRHVFVRRIGGVTGDTLGAGVEIAEVFALIIMAWYLS